MTNCQRQAGLRRLFQRSNCHSLVTKGSKRLQRSGTKDLINPNIFTLNLTDIKSGLPQGFFLVVVAFSYGVKWKSELRFFAEYVMSQPDWPFACKMSSLHRLNLSHLCRTCCYDSWVTTPKWSVLWGRSDLSSRLNRVLPTVRNTDELFQRFCKYTAVPR